MKSIFSLSFGNKLLAALMVVMLAVAALPVGPAYAATFTVSKTADTNDGTCDADCSLREALVAANATAGADIITLVSGSTYTFSLAGAGEDASATGDLDVTDAAGVTINTSGAGAAIINANSIDRVLDVRPGAALTLNNINVTNGSVGANGGGLLMAGASLTITNGSVSNNLTTAGNDGGAIYVSAGTVTINGTSFTNNTSADDGGALYLIAGTTTISNATFDDNTGFDIGGAIRNDAVNTSITRTTFLNNAGNSNNTAPGGVGGGGIFINDTANNTTITLSTFQGNSTTHANSARGGAIYTEGTNVIVANSTFTGNSANENVAGAAGDVAQGGAIFQDDVGGINPSLTLYNVTLSGNTTTVNGLGTASGASIYKNTATGTITVANTIVANGTPNNCSGSAVTDGGNNINFNTADCGFANTANPSFGALTGSPAYFPLNAGSPAIDTGSNAVCAAAPVNNASQNGLIRPVNGDAVAGAVCDIGSYEAPALNTAPSGTDNTITINEDASHAFAAADFGFTDPDIGDTMSAVRVDSLPLAGSLTLSSVPVTAGQVILTANIPNLLFTPAANANGSPYASFTFSVRDTNGPAYDTTPNTMTFNVTAVNDPSVAVDDTATVAEDAAATAINVRANDTDSEDGFTTELITGITQPTNGTVVNNGTDLTYAPDANYCAAAPATDDFTYTLAGGSTATVAVTVTCVNDPSIAVDDTATVAEDAAATAINVRANDTDSEDGFTTELITLASDPANGTVVITGGGTGLTYQPDLNYCAAPPATDDFTYTLAGGDTATVAVTVNCVNDAPSFTAVNPPAVAINAGAQTINSWATFNPGPNESGQSVLQYNVSGSTCGTLLFAGPLVSITGTLTYTPATDQTGSCTFDVTVQDDGGTVNGGVDTSSPAQTYTITVSVPTVTLSPATLPDGTLGFAYSQTITASGGTSP